MVGPTQYLGRPHRSRARIAVSVTPTHFQVTENMSKEKADVPTVSRTSKIGSELIDSTELAARWNVPESWIRSHTRTRTAKEDRIPCIRLGRYVRFRWGSVELETWLAKRLE